MSFLRKNLSCIKPILISLLFVPFLVFAQNQMVLPNAGLTPESSFYFIDVLGETVREFFTFNKEAKANLQASLAAERISEIEKMLDNKGITAEGIEVAKLRLKESLIKIVTIVADKKSKGEDVSALAKKLDSTLEGLEASLSSVFNKHKKSLGLEEDELKTEFITNYRGSDEEKKEALFEKLSRIEVQKELIDLKEQDIKDGINTEEEKLEKLVGAQYAAEEAIQATEEEREKIQNKAIKKDVEIPAHDFVGFDDILFQAQEAFERQDYQEAQNLANQALFYREKLETVIKELEEERKNEFGRVVQKSIEKKQLLIDKIQKEGVEIPSAAFEKFDSNMVQTEIFIIIENFDGAKQLTEKTDEILKEVEIGMWNVFTSEKFGFEFRYPLSWQLGRNIESEYQGYELVTVSFSDEVGLKGYIDMQVSKRNRKLLSISQLLESFGSPRKFEPYGNVAGVEAIKSHGYSGTAINFTKGVSFFNIEARDTSDEELREVLNTFIFTQEEVKASDLAEPTLKEPRIELVDLSARSFPSATGEGYDIEFTWTAPLGWTSLRIYEAENGICGPNSTWYGQGLLNSFEFGRGLTQVTKSFPSLTAGSKVCAQLWDDYYESLIASDPILIVIEPALKEPRIELLNLSVQAFPDEIGKTYQIEFTLNKPAKPGATIWIWATPDCKNKDSDLSKGGYIKHEPIVEGMKHVFPEVLGSGGNEYCGQIWQDYYKGIPASNPVTFELPRITKEPIQLSVEATPSAIRDIFNVKFKWEGAPYWSRLYVFEGACKAVDQGYIKGEEFANWQGWGNDQYGFQATISATTTYCGQIWENFDKGYVASNPATIVLEASPKELGSEETSSESVGDSKEEQTLLSLSDEELEKLTKLWANGMRCSKGFALPSPPEDLVEVDNVRFYINLVDVNFIDDATCEDAERIAQLIDAKIIGFGPINNLYEFEIETRTIVELEEAIATIEALNDPKIEAVFSVTPLTAEWAE